MSYPKSNVAGCAFYPLECAQSRRSRVSYSKSKGHAVTQQRYRGAGKSMTPTPHAGRSIFYTTPLNYEQVSIG